jgi:hypothetical protein
MKRKMFKIKLTYIYTSDAALPLKTQVIIDSLTGNAHFPNLPVTLADLQKAKDDFDKSLSLAKLGDERAIAQKNILRERLEDLLHEQASYVQGVAKSDLDILSSSGFEIVRDRLKNNRDTFAITPGKTSGVVTSVMNGLRKVRVYYHQYTPDPVTPESVWTEVMSTTRKVTIFGLEPGVKYWFRVKAITKLGTEVITDPIARIVS